MTPEEIGEVAGIFAGDGTLYRTQGGIVMEVRGDSREVEYYEKYVRKLFGKAFGIKLKVIKRYYANKTGYVLGIRVCGKRTKEFLSDFLGFPIGEKSDIVRVPDIILKNQNSWISYVRGIFDTDGSVYVRKCGAGLAYRQPVIDIFSNSNEHILQIKAMMEWVGFKVWIEGNKRKIRMAGWGNAERFFKVIKPHNNRKLERFRAIKAGMAERSKAQTG